MQSNANPNGPSRALPRATPAGATRGPSRPVPSPSTSNRLRDGVQTGPSRAREGTHTREAQRPEVGSLWRDREGNVWRLHRYNDGGPWCQLRGVTRFDGVPFDGAHWHCDWMLDLVRKAVPADA